MTIVAVALALTIAATTVTSSALAQEEIIEEEIGEQENFTAPLENMTENGNLTGDDAVLPPLPKDEFAP